MNINTFSTTSYPQFNEDLFTDEALKNSAPLYKKIRDAGDAVWCPELNVFLVGRYADVKKCLRASDRLISGAGVTLNEKFNEATAGRVTSTIQSDGEQHKRIKTFSMKPMTIAGVAYLKEHIQNVANERVAELLNTGEFEAMTALASYMPINVIGELVGIKSVDAANMHAWSMAANDAGGPSDHPRTMAAEGKDVLDLFAFLQNLSRSDVKPGSWVDQLFDAIDNGDLEEHEGRSMMAEYIAPALDTTAVAIGELLFRLGKQPEAFDKLKADPELIPAAVNEAVRLATPIRGFTRKVVDDFQLSESVLPKGSRVWLINASANLDERHYDNPEVFNVERNPRDQLAWGHGPHLCNGTHLARAEMEALLTAVVEQVLKIEAGTPTRIVNNLLQGFESLPLKLSS